MIKSIVKRRALYLLGEIEVISDQFIDESSQKLNSSSVIQQSMASVIPDKQMKQIRSITFQLQILQMIFSDKKSGDNEL